MCISKNKTDQLYRKMMQYGIKLSTKHPPENLNKFEKQETLPKVVGVVKFDFTKTFRNQLFSRVRVLYHHYLVTNHSESILKSKIMSILMIIFVVVFSL